MGADTLCRWCVGMQGFDLVDSALRGEISASEFAGRFHAWVDDLTGFDSRQKHPISQLTIGAVLKENPALAQAKPPGKDVTVQQLLTAAVIRDRLAFQLINDAILCR